MHYEIRSKGRTVGRRKFLNGAVLCAVEYEKRRGDFCQPLAIIKLDRSGLPAPGVFSWDVRDGAVCPALEMRADRLINLRSEFARSEVVARPGFEGGTRPLATAVGPFARTAPRP